jgi:hypothetical protein
MCLSFNRRFAWNYRSDAHRGCGLELNLARLRRLEMVTARRRSAGMRRRCRPGCGAGNGGLSASRRDLNPCYRGERCFRERVAPRSPLQARWNTLLDNCWTAISLWVYPIPTAAFKAKMDIEEQNMKPPHLT